MHVEDMIFISVDDHVVEPPHMFEGRLPARYVDQAPQVVRTDEGDDVWVFNGADDPQHRAQRRRRAAEGGVRRQPDVVRRDAARLLRHPRAGQGHERRAACWRRMCFPSFPSFSRPAVRRRRRQGAGRSPSCGPTTTGTSTSGAAPIPGRFIPMALPMLWDPELARGRDPPRGREGMPLADVHREPGDARATRASTTRTGTRCGRRWSTRARSSTSTSARRASSRSPRPTRRWT